MSNTTTVDKLTAMLMDFNRSWSDWEKKVAVATSSSPEGGGVSSSVVDITPYVKGQKTTSRGRKRERKRIRG